MESLSRVFERTWQMKGSSNGKIMYPLGTVDRYIGGHLGISLYQTLCWPMHFQLLTNGIDQREDRVQSFEHQVSTYF